MFFFFGLNCLFACVRVCLCMFWICVPKWYGKWISGARVAYADTEEGRQRQKKKEYKFTLNRLNHLILQRTTTPPNKKNEKKNQRATELDFSIDMTRKRSDSFEFLSRAQPNNFRRTMTKTNVNNGNKYWVLLRFVLFSFFSVLFFRCATRRKTLRSRIKNESNEKWLQ